MSRFERLIIYKALLASLEEGNHISNALYDCKDFQMCNTINNISEIYLAYVIPGYFPELQRFKPKNVWKVNEQFWWHPKNRTSRINAVKKAIRLTVYEQLIEDLINQDETYFHPNNSLGTCYFIREFYSQYKEYVPHFYLNSEQYEEAFPELYSQRKIKNGAFYWTEGSWKERLNAAIEAKALLLESK